MKRDLTIRRTILAMALAAFGVSGTALAADEMEPANSNFGTAQALEIGAGGIATVTASISSSSDLDFYSFEAKVGDDITIDIDGTTPPHDTVVYVFNPSGIRRYTGQDGEPVDYGSSPYEPGATATFDPYFQFKIDMDGTWKIGVAAFSVLLGDQGVRIRGSNLTTGPYALIVSGLKASMQQINVDIRPGNDELAVLNPKAKGVLPVALLSDKDFDPFEVDVTSLRFGSTGEEASLARCAKDGRDLNGDGKPDRVCHFDNEKAGFRKTDTLGKVKGMKGGKPFQGTGDLKVVPQKRGE